MAILEEEKWKIDNRYKKNLKNRQEKKNIHKARNYFRFNFFNT